MLCLTLLIFSSFTGKLPIANAHQVFTTTTLELPHEEEEKQTITFNNNQDESAPPLPPKPLAG